MVGEPAFPTKRASYRMEADSEGSVYESPSHHVGLNKREYFAIRIFEALIISGGTSEVLDKARMAFQCAEIFMETAHEPV